MTACGERGARVTAMSQCGSKTRPAGTQTPSGALCSPARQVRRGAACRRAAYRRHPDRQSRRHHAARARNAGRRRRDRLRGHAGDAQAPRPLRHRDAAHALSRPQRGQGAARAAAPARRGRGDCAGLRCRHAAYFRSGIQARARRAGSRASRSRRCPAPSALLTALTVAGLPTDQFFFAGFLPPKAAARRSRIAELARIPATLVLFETGPRLAADAWPISRRALVHARSSRLPRTHQAARRSPPRRSRDAGAKLRRPANRAARSSSSSRRRRGAGKQRRRRRRPCCARRWRASRSRTPSAKSRTPPACRAARSISAHWR